MRDCLIKVSEEDMKLVKVPEGTPKIGYRKKLEWILPRKYLGLVYAVVNKLHPWVYRETQNISPLILYRVRIWCNIGVEVEVFGVTREDKPMI